jgi:hypothetical protein
MKKSIIVTVLGLSTIVGQAKAAPPVCPDPVKLACLKKNFASFYRKEYDRFFDAFHRFENDALSCKSSKETAEFLDLAAYIKGNAEVGEAFAETVEKMIVRTPKCFLDASASLPDSFQKFLVQQYLKEPTFEDSKVIEKIMKKEKTNPKYRSLMNYYFKNKQCTTRASDADRG